MANGGTNVGTFPAVMGIVYATTATSLTATAQGASGTLLHGNGVSAPSFGAVALATEVSGTLPIANGGTNNTSYTDGSLIFYNSTGTKFDQNNANLFWDNSTKSIGVGNITPRASIEVTGDIRASGSVEVGSLLVDGKTVYTPSATRNIVAGTGVTAAMVAASNVILIQGSGGNVTVTANPAIAAGTDGQIIVLVGVNDSQTVLFTGGTGIRLSANTNFTMGDGDVLEMIYSSAVSVASWIEISRTDN